MSDDTRGRRVPSSTVFVERRAASTGMGQLLTRRRVIDHCRVATCLCRPV
ncbi:MAG: hypothetical protein WCA46_24040 [Actinocatenispora sp.]